jgi:hypothetical protein
MEPSSWNVFGRSIRRSIVAVAMSVTLMAILSASMDAQRVTVDNAKTGAYRALAQLIFQSFKKGDLDTAATLGRILDRTWDQIEENGERGLNKSNPKLFEEIDQAMDAFIKPVIHSDQKAPDPRAVETAYNAYLDKLKAAD